MTHDRQERYTMASAAVARLERIGTLPEITTRIIAAANDRRTTAEDLEQIIAHDPALVASILKLVNSALYARAKPVESAEHAIVVLGFEAVKNLAISKGLGRLFGQTRLCEGFTAKDLWDHCIAVAVASREFARLTRQCPAEQAFLAGLLHDVGILAALQLWPEKVVEMYQSARADPEPFCLVEQRFVGMDHQDLGAALAAQWGFPPACQAASGFHHSPGDATSDHALVAMVHTADVLCCHEGAGFNLTEARQDIDSAAVAPFIPSATIEQVRGDLTSTLWSAVTVFGS